MAKKPTSTKTINIIVGIIVAIILGAVALAIALAHNNNSTPQSQYTKEELELLQMADASRKSNLASITAELYQYQTNNRGALPSSPDRWQQFVTNYVTETKDPMGAPYQFEDPCLYTETDSGCVAPKSLTWSANKYQIYIAIHATCDFDSETGLKYSSSSRKAALYSALELQDYYCIEI